jgi:hypothetical protein
MLASLSCLLDKVSAVVSIMLCASLSLVCCQSFVGGPGGGAEDVQRSPWGSVVLVQTRQIHAHSHSLYRSLSLGAGRTVKQGE